MSLGIPDQAKTKHGSKISLNVDILDGSGNQITSFGGGTQYAEGGTAATITGTAVMWEDTSDTLRVASAAKPLPVNIISGAGSGGTAIADDAAFTVASTSLTPVGGIYRSSLDSVDDGDAGAFAMTANRIQMVNLRDASGNELSVGGGTQYDEDTASTAADKVTMAGVVRSDTAASLVGTDGDRTQLIVDSTGKLHVNPGTVTVASHAVTNAGTFAVQNTAATPAGNNNIGDVDVATIAAGDNNIGNVDIVTMPTVTVNAHAVTNAGTFAVQVDGSALTALQLIDDTVFAEDVAATAADKGVAVLAVRRDADTTLVGTDNDYANLQVDAAGKLKVEVFDGGDSHTVDNAGTFAVQATLQAGTAAFGKLSANSGVDIGDVDVTSIAAGDNNIGNVDIVTMPTVTVNAHHVTNAGTFAVQSTNQTGDNTIGRVKLTDGTDVADILDLTNSNPLTVAIVDGSGDQISSFGGGTQYTEDAAAAANPVGTVPILVRKDTPASEVSADGDNIAQRGTAYGASYVTLLDTGGSPVSVGGGTQYDEDTASGAADKLTMAGVVRKDTAATLVGTDGDRTQLQVDATGYLYVKDKHADINSDNLTDIVTYTSVISDSVGGAFANEDDASAGDEGGFRMIALRKDTPGNTSDADGDYEFLQVSGGRLWVDASGKTLTVASHAVTNAGTFAVQVDGSALTSLQLIDDTVFAEDVAHTTADKGIQTLTVRKDTSAATSGTDGDYQPQVSNARGATWVAIEDGAGGQITSFGGGTEYTEDAAAAANPIGKALIGVRADTLAGVTSADGDNVAARMTDKGELYVKHADALTVSSHAVTNAGTFVVQENGGALTALQKIDDPVLVDDAAFTPATSSVMMAGFEYDDTSPDSVNEGDAGAARMSANRSIYMQLRDADGNERGAKITSRGALVVEGDLNGQAFNIQQSNATQLKSQVQGEAAHDAAISGNPLRVGARAETALSGITLVADGDATDLHAGVDGVLITRDDSGLEDKVSGTASNTDGANTQVIASSGAGVKTYITDVTIANTSSSNIYVELKDGTTAKWVFPVPANGGVTHSFKTPLAGTAATAWNFDPSAATTTVYCSAAGFKSKI